MHFTESSMDQSLDGKECSTFAGLAKKLQSTAFLQNLALMHDALAELSDLSKSLQADSMNLSKAHRLIVRQTEIFTARKADAGEGQMSKVAADCVTSGTYQNVCIVPLAGKHVVINRQQFYQALCDALTA